jgi:2'-5' RNA ligase
MKFMKFLNEKKYDYSSIQVSLKDTEVQDILKDFKIDEDDLSGDGKETEPHITIKYGLHTSNFKEVYELLKDTKPIVAILDEISLFENDEDVIKVDVKGKDLHDLNKYIKDNLKYTDTYPDYNPHMTIAYVKKGTGKKYINGSEFKNKKIIFNELEFSCKDGSKEKITLKGK